MFLKAVIIGVTLWLIFRDPFFLVLGVIVAQIDPLSVSALMQGNRMSSKAKSILSSWASFDDPMTVLLALYTPVLVTQILDVNFGSRSTDLFLYFQNLGLNLAIALAAFCLYLLAKHYSKRVLAWIGAVVSASTYLLLLFVVSISIAYFTMLSVALAGLFLRPPIEKYLNLAIKYALGLAIFLLGALLVNGVNILAGIALGIMAYLSQVIVGFILTRRLPKEDSWHIAFAQQNGITAIILALLFEPVHPGTIAIVAPAILVINSLHFSVNKLLDKYVLDKI